VLRFGLFRREGFRRSALRLGFATLVGLSLSNWIAAQELPAPSKGAFDSLPKEQIFGAEIQYFRLRGGDGPNISPDKVLQLWNNALKAAKDAGMNMVSFYIPWDFHEPKEGEFAFRGTPDYPSRNVKRFIDLIGEYGFKYIMVRPGPYINAEWGHLEYGSVPLWFEEKYRDSHMRDPLQRYTRLFDYRNADFLRATQDWFKKVYENVIVTNTGSGKPIRFVQLDNETNYLWQSIFDHDYSAQTVQRYRNFLIKKYETLDVLNAAHRRSWQSFDDIQPPTVAGYNFWEDKDWYRFHDEEIHDYLMELRKYWESLGLREPDVLFTSAESYNAAKDGLLPNYIYRNDKVSGLMTVNLYPKTEEEAHYTSLKEEAPYPYLNKPFKVDHDVIAEEAASQYYFGPGNSWVMGPEIQGGWFRGTRVTPEARQQTYLSAIGHGMKAMIVYYFHEGENWDSDWARQKIQPYYDQLRADPRYQRLLPEQLLDVFWSELQKIVDEKLMVGFRVKEEMTNNRLDAGTLYFDAPLDMKGKPRLNMDGSPQENYRLLQDIGKKIIADRSEWLGRAVSIQDPVCLLKDVREQAPSRVPGIDSNNMNSDWAAGLIGYALNSNINMKIVHWGINTGDLDKCQLIFHHDGGDAGEDVAERLGGLIRSGHIVVNFFDDSLANKLGVKVGSQNISGSSRRKIEFLGTKGAENSFTVLSSPLFEYALPTNGPPAGSDQPQCFPVFRSVEVESVNGYGCFIGRGEFYQLGFLLYDVFNSDDYASAEDIKQRTLFLKRLLHDHNIISRIAVAVSVDDEQARVVAFGRQVPDRPEFWVTAKSGSESHSAFRVTVRDADPETRYSVEDLLSTRKQTLTGQELRTQGFDADLDRVGSTVYWIAPERANASKPPT
jgi:hypothetical protein